MLKRTPMKPGRGFPKPVLERKPRPKATPATRKASITRCDALAKPVLKENRVSMGKIKESARGEECQVRYPGTCTFDPAKTIWSHCRHGAAGRGKGIKALDLAGAYACTACDQLYDGQIPRPIGFSREQADLDWFHGMVRSLVILVQKGLVVPT